MEKNLNHEQVTHTSSLSCSREGGVVPSFHFPITTIHSRFLRTTTLFPLCHVYLFISLCYSLSLYPFTERYAQPYFFSCLIRQMVNTHTDADLSAAVQNALQTLLPQIREEFRTSSGPSDSGGNPPPISHMEKIFDVMGCEDAFKTRLAVYKFEGNALAWWKAYKQAKGGDEHLKREYHSIRQMDTETSTEFMQRFLRLVGFLGAAAGTAEEQAKNFQWGLRRSTLNHFMCMPDVAQVANAARNYEILHERDDDDAERPDKRRVVIGISRPLNRVVTGTMVIIMTVMDQTGDAVVTTTAAATTTTLPTTTG
uniref:Zinc finger, CCHC-type, retrotransposon Gag domain protein n=1 Tax=Tanacetum cinerariifolium TaxID=118510 RepID=A0A699KJM7_TANCI|nr:hypothetical protein [Tanacetum cinerariifolium]